MNNITEMAGLRFDPLSSRTYRIVAIIAGVIVFAVLAVFAFQFFGRYQYLAQGGTILRVDRLTSQVCHVSQWGADCADARPSRSRSISVSVSPSLSISTSLTKAPKR